MSGVDIQQKKKRVEYVFFEWQLKIFRMLPPPIQYFSCLYVFVCLSMYACIYVDACLGDEYQNENEVSPNK